MTILGKNIDRHTLENNKKMESYGVIQVVVMIEDNVFTLQYCIEAYYKF